jgi:type II secretory pathway pseudopilin PulG
MKRAHGFTVIELLVAIVFLGAASAILFTQRQGLMTTQRDDTRKVAINAIYYSLEEVFHAKNGYYPSKIDDTNLSSMDPTLFTDPDGDAINTGASDYRYEPTNCDIDGKCKSYTLRGLLEKEADYVKKSRQ